MSTPEFVVLMTVAAVMVVGGLLGILACIGGTKTRRARWNCPHETYDPEPFRPRRTTGIRIVWRCGTAATDQRDDQANAGTRPHLLEQMPHHPEKPGALDDYTEQRYRRIVAPLEAEHHKPRRFDLADYEREAT